MERKIDGKYMTGKRTWKDIGENWQRRRKQVEKERKKQNMKNTHEKKET